MPNCAMCLRIPNLYLWRGCCRSVPLLMSGSLTMLRRAQGSSLFEHDLFRKPVPTFRDHALANELFLPCGLVRLDDLAGLLFGRPEVRLIAPITEMIEVVL